MKLFAIYAAVDLIDKPIWLDEYRKNLEQFYDFHVTLKQSCYIEERRLSDVKNKLSVLFSELKLADHEIHIVFEKLVTDGSDPTDGVIMIQAQNPPLSNLQKRIISVLSDYKQYYEPASQEWEENFKPHITIACNLDSEKFRVAQKDIPQDYVCAGVIREVKLSVVDPKDTSSVGSKKEIVVYKL